MFQACFRHYRTRGWKALKEEKKKKKGKKKISDEQWKFSSRGSIDHQLKPENSFQRINEFRL